MLNPITEEDQSILDWFESQSEETLRDLSDRFDAGSPREFWTAFLADCTPPAQECPGDSLAAPAEAGQVVCTSSGIHCLPGMLAYGRTCKTFLFVRVENGAWVWWAAMDVGSGGAGAWQCAGLSVKLVMQAGHLMSLTGNNMLALSAGGGIVEWGFKLQRAVAQVQAVEALIKVW